MPEEIKPFVLFPDERRVHQRHDIMAQVRVVRGRVTHILDVTNISLSGAFISTGTAKRASRFRVGQEIDIDVFAAEELDNVRVRGTIARIVCSGSDGPFGFGVRFTGVGDEAGKAIARLVEAAAARPSRPAGPPPLPQTDG